MSGTLYVVATPLGNLEDMSFRAVRILKEVALIAAEDTRHSRKLLAHYDIRTPLISYYDQVERQKAPRLVERITAGDSVALIADAGTPGIADPGYRLVCAAVAAGLRVTPIPGPSAVTAALSASALPTDRFAFEGFVPARPAARRAFYEGLRREARTVVCFETARRLTASLQDLAAVLGERNVVVARELTKLHEEFLRGAAIDVASRSGERRVARRGGAADRGGGRSGAGANGGGHANRAAPPARRGLGPETGGATARRRERLVGARSLPSWSRDGGANAVRSGRFQWTRTRRLC